MNNSENIRRLSLLKLTVFDNEYINIQPSEKQALFLTSDKKEILFGGSAGGGKTTASLLAALQYVKFKDYHALIIRKSYSDLAQANGALFQMREMLIKYSDVKYDMQAHMFKFPSGSSISFGYLSSPIDKFRYQGSAYNTIIFDELTQHREEDYLYLFSRLRKSIKSKLPIRMLSTANPGGIGHQWVKERFVDEHKDATREFIPSTLKDNPYLDQKEYENSLEKLPLVEKLRLLDGNWDVTEEGMFKRENFITERLDDPTKFIGCQKIRTYDLGFGGDYSASALICFRGGKFYVLDMVLHKGSINDFEAIMQKICLKDGKSIPIYIEQSGGPGKGVYDLLARMLVGHSVFPYKPIESKTVRAQYLSSIIQNKNMIFNIAPWNKIVFEQLEAFPSTKHDDAVDCLSLGVNSLTKERCGLLIPGRGTNW